MLTWTVPGDDGTDGYINGGQYGIQYSSNLITWDRADADITNSISANDTTIYLGKVGSSYFSGNIDEVRIWKRALPLEEILRDFNRYMIGKEDGIFAYLRMNGIFI